MYKNKEFYLFYLLLFLSYFFSLALFNKIVLPTYEHLKYWPVHYKVFADFYREGQTAFDIFLGGSIKWHYHGQLFQPITLLTLLFDIEIFLYVFDFLEKTLAFYFCYILSKKICKNKKISGLIGLFYATIIHIKIVYIMPGSAFCFAPYLFYLLIKDKPLSIKHYIIFFIAGLSSSPLGEFGILLIFPLAYLLQKKKDIKNIVVSFFLFFLGMLVIVSPLVLSIMGEVMHRVDQSISVENIELFNISLANVFSLFHSFKYFVYLMVVLLGLISSNKKIKIINFFLIFIFIVILISVPLRDIIALVSSILKSFNFQRIENIIPFLIVLITMYLFEDKKNSSYLKTLSIAIFVTSIILQISFQLSVLVGNLKKSLITEKKNLVTNIMYSKEKNIYKITSILNIILNKKNYGPINLFDTKRNFKDYYRFTDYLKYKKIIGESRVGSIGVDPMIAVMNDIKIIDGYHQLYPKSYKIKFREIISKELELLKKNNINNNFDTWGNQVYIYYYDSEDIKVNFDQMKKLGAKYLISSFEINKEELILKLSSGDTYLYIIK